MTDELDYVKAQLARRRGQLETVARATKVSRRTIGNLMEGDGVNVRTLTKLHSYLKANVRKKVLDEPPPDPATADRSGHDSEVGAVLG